MDRTAAVRLWSGIAVALCLGVGCSVDQVGVRLNHDLSGQFTTVLAVDRQLEHCGELPGELQRMVKRVVENDPELASVLLHSPFNDGKVGGVRTMFRFESPDEIPLRIGQIQRMRLEQDEREDPTELQREIGDLLGQVDSLPVDFESLISPVRRIDGKRVWVAEFRGDPSVLATFNFGDDSSRHCTRPAIAFTVSMPAKVEDFSPKSGRATATVVDSHTVSWNIPREGGAVALRAIASEPDPDFVAPAGPDDVSGSPTTGTREEEGSSTPLLLLGVVGLVIVAAGLYILRRRKGLASQTRLAGLQRAHEGESTSLRYFFSYSRVDSDFVVRLATKLRDAAVDIWLDQIDIPAGTPWDTAIEEALRTAGGMIIVLSPDSCRSDNVLNELAFALDENKLIIPVLLKPCDIPLRIRRMNYIDFTGDFDSAMDRLRARIERNSAAGE